VVKIVCSGRQQYECDKHIYFYIVLLRFYETGGSSPVITQPLCKNGGSASIPSRPLLATWGVLYSIEVAGARCFDSFYL